MLRCIWRLAALSGGVLFLALASALDAGTLRTISVDGEFEDWAGIAPLATDPTGDATSGDVDFGQIWMANDDGALYLRIELNRETLAQDGLGGAIGNDIHLFLDGDDNSGTGLAIDGIGADLEIAYGLRSGTLYTPSTQALVINEIGSVVLPTHSADQFEIRIPFSVTPGFSSVVNVVTASSVSLFMRDDAGLDRIPDTGVLAYAVASGIADPVVPIELGRIDAGDIRILSHNVLNTQPAFNPNPFTRILQSLQPDIVSWQELRPNDWTPEEARQFVEAALPLPMGEQWVAAGFNDTVTITRFPILNQSNSDGNLIVHIDLPDDRADTDLVIFNAHTPCCNNEFGRDVEHDRISATWRDFINGVGPFVVDPGVAVAMMGDFNMVGFVRQLITLRDGILIDNVTFGADFSPGRDLGSLANVRARHTHTADIVTWFNPGSSFAPGKLDYILFSSDAATLKRNYTLKTDEIPMIELTAAGLEAGDSNASDHLVMIADFDFKTPGSAAMLWPPLDLESYDGD